MSSEWCFADDRYPELRRAVHRLCAYFPGAYWQKMDEQRAYPTAFVQAMTGAGFLAALIPEEYGGAGFGHLELAMIAEEVGRALAPIPFASSGYFATAALLVAGTAEQKKKYLPQPASGDALGTFAPTAKLGQNRAQAVAARGPGGALARIEAREDLAQGAGEQVAEVQLGADGAPVSLDLPVNLGDEARFFRIVVHPLP